MAAPSYAANSKLILPSLKGGFGLGGMLAAKSYGLAESLARPLPTPALSS